MAVVPGVSTAVGRSYLPVSRFSSVPTNPDLLAVRDLAGAPTQHWVDNEKTRKTPEHDLVSLRLTDDGRSSSVRCHWSRRRHACIGGDEDKKEREEEGAAGVATAAMTTRRVCGHSRQRPGERQLGRKDAL